MGPRPVGFPTAVPGLCSRRGDCRCTTWDAGSAPPPSCACSLLGHMGRTATCTVRRIKRLYREAPGALLGTSLDPQGAQTLLPPPGFQAASDCPCKPARCLGFHRVFSHACKNLLYCEYPAPVSFPLRKVTSFGGSGLFCSFLQPQDVALDKCMIGEF